MKNADAKNPIPRTTNAGLIFTASENVGPDICDEKRYVREVT